MVTVKPSNTAAAVKPAVESAKPQAAATTPSANVAKPQAAAVKPATDNQINIPGAANRQADFSHPSGLNTMAALQTKAKTDAANSDNPFQGSVALYSPPGSAPPGGVPEKSVLAGSTPPGPAPVGSTQATVPAGAVKVFGGSQSNENNIDFANASGADMLVIAERNLNPGEKDPGGTVFRVPAGKSISVSAADSVGLRFQVFNGQLTPEQQAQLAQGGTVDGIVRPTQTDVLYETHYNPQNHTSHDDISPLDGARTPMRLSGQGGRSVAFTQEIINGAPVRNPDGSIPGLGPSVSPTDNNAGNPVLRDYYNRMSLRPDGTRDFYYNSSDSGAADKANVSYSGTPGTTRTVVTLG